jgi:hypothetical protein
LPYNIRDLVYDQPIGSRCERGHDSVNLFPIRSFGQTTVDGFIGRHRRIVVVVVLYGAPLFHERDIVERRLVDPASVTDNVFKRRIVEVGEMIRSVGRLGRIICVIETLPLLIDKLSQLALLV